MTTIAKFIIENKLHMRAEHVASNPYIDDDKNWAADHWRCQLRNSRTTAQMIVYFSMGSGHGGREPLQKDVLDSLASDSAGFENAQSFEAWAGEYGYDTDSRKAERTYQIVKKQALRLKKFLGQKVYDELLWKVERL